MNLVSAVTRSRIVAASLRWSLGLLAMSGLAAGTLQPSASADEGFQFLPVPVSLIGNGCPPGTATAVLSGDTLSVSFAAFEAVADASRKVVSQSCNLRLGLSVPQGYNLQPINVKYIGFTDVPQGGSGALNIRLLFNGGIIGADNTNFGPGFSSAWERNIPITLGTINACAGPVSSVFGINSNITSRARNVGAGESTQVRIDTIDTSIGRVIYQIRFGFLPC